MSRKVSTEPIKMTTGSGTQTQLQGQHTGPEIVESYAERLINEVFEDVERVLEGGSLPKQPIRTEYVSVQTVTVPPIVLPTTVVIPPKEEPAKGKTVEAKAVKSDEKDGNSFDKWLFGGACGALAITLLLWLASRSELQQLFVKAPAPSPAAAPAAPPAPPNPKAEADAKFSQYLIQSLDAITSKQVAVQTAAKQPGVVPSQTINLAPLPMSLNLADAPSLAQALNRLADSLNKVAVQPPASTSAPAKPPVASPLPVVSATTVAKAPTPAPTTKPVASSSPTTKQTPTPTPTVTQTVTATPTPTVTQTVTASPTPSPTVTVTVTASPEANTASIPAPSITLQALPTLDPIPTETAPPVASTPLSVSILRGTLEFGERSAALFDIDGVPRRVYVGESIGSSGWTLGEVSQDGVTIRRNGEVRSIGVGQQL
ncbi:hypothetical protein NG798_12275 [Ancylothrix sp. C2]|uniref:hypothetical protein n=1 Tax=Ancylothrix sp. D3o TaxID=2953691 RepID=UPI0021BB7F13|nr:hypothetical protein [Ancylothrix sp. D3o]MCT7950569.1 hypothetical protein [Ancylothrix sp. D3o]